MDLIDANMERRLNVPEVIEFAVESWNTISGVFIRSSGIITAIIDAPQIANRECKMIIESPALPSNKTAAIWMI